jgi:formate hydrogenlyase subunit 6/NADH:ubiquinone oxidoreductase subunit I
MKLRPGKMIKEVLGTIFKKPATTKYPYTKAEVPEGFRGEIIFHADKCIGCKLCMKDCPTGAITIKEVGEKKFEAVIDLGKCIYCAQCVDSCPKKALEVTSTFELAQLDEGKLTVVFHAEPPKDTQDKT